LVTMSDLPVPFILISSYDASRCTVVPQPHEYQAVCHGRAADAIT
jgi:hypothetical protein